MSADPEEAKAYFAAWYAKNRGAVSARRKKRYRTDPEYREGISARNTSYREHARGGKPSAAFWARGEAQVTRKSARRLLPRLKADGTCLSPCYTSGVLLDSIHVTMPTLKAWHEKKIIPEATDTDLCGRKWYSVDYITKLAGLVQTARKEGWSNTQFAEAVAAAFGQEKGGTDAGKRKRSASSDRHVP